MPLMRMSISLLSMWLSLLIRWTRVSSTVLEDASVAFMPRLGFALSQPQGLERLGPEMLVSPRDAP